MTLKRHSFRAVATIVSLLGVLFFASGDLQLQAQNRKNFSIVSEQTGHVALGLAIRKLQVAGAFMQCPAHPDDETNVLFALYGYGQGLRVIDVQNNRGEGGQNEIGPELFRDIGVLRTSELLAAHRIDGAEQYFTRAIDYGYSWDPQEAINKWGREEIVGDYVRLIRTLRPDVILTMNIQGGGGDRAHEATTILARESFRAAGDPSKYPEQIREGLRPWQASKLYFAGAGGGRGGRGGPGGAGASGRGAGGAGGAGNPPAAGGAAAQAAAAGHVARVETGLYDSLLSRTYTEIASDARSSHKCQGVGSGVPALPGVAGGRGGAPGGGGPGGAVYTLVDSTISGQMDKDETSLFDGVDVSLTGLAKYAGSPAPPALVMALASINDQGQRAKQAFDAGNDAATAAPIEAGLTELRALRSRLGAIGLSDSAKFEIDHRLKTKEEDFQNAVIAAHGLSFVAVADDGLVVGGQPIRLTLVANNHGPTDVAVTDVAIQGFDSPAACTPAAVKKDTVFTCASAATIPKNAKLTEPPFTEKYWSAPDGPARSEFDPSVPFGSPFTPSPFRVVFHLKAGSVDVTRELAVDYRYVKDLYFGDKNMELNVVPAFSVKTTPSLAVFPAQVVPSPTAISKDVFVSVTNGTKGAAKVTVALEVPTGWKVAPASAPISFQNEDEALSAKFQLTAPAGVKAGAYSVRAVVTSDVTGTERFSTGYQEIDYPHVERRQVIKPAEEIVKVIRVKTLPNTKVGYIVGVGDQVPPAIEELGGKVSFIEQDELAWGDLSKYDVIMTGVRAYERRADLRAYNRRLLDYVEKGGTVIVNYNKTEFNAGAVGGGRGGGGFGPGGGGPGGGRGATPPTQGGYGPFPGLVDGSRVNDESVPVTILVPTHPIFNYPNEIGALSWEGWLQERGQYFLTNKDPRYVDLISMTDSFPDNPGVKLGSLVEAKVGKGRWVYVGLGLWRQLPAGTDGAYQLLANLLALPHPPVAPTRR